jgi:plasmid stability protein
MHNACMSQLTVRNLPDAVSERLRLIAEQSGLSLNRTVVRILEAATGGRPTAGRRRDLSAIGGQWTDQDATAFDRATAVFEAVDEEVWR